MTHDFPDADEINIRPDKGPGLTSARVLNGRKKFAKMGKHGQARCAVPSALTRRKAPPVTLATLNPGTPK